MPEHDGGPRRDPSATLFVSDPTVEAEGMTRALRSSGYSVVDVPLSMLVARVAVQAPRVVLVDADSHGAFEVVARMRELPHGDGIPVLFIAEKGGAVANQDEALAHEGSGLFVRPLDLAALVREVDALTGDSRAAEAHAFKTNPVPQTILPAAKRPSSPPSMGSISAGLRSSWGSRARVHGQGAGEGVQATSDPPPPSSYVPPVRTAPLPAVSADLQRLLAEAEERAQVGADEPAIPSPDQEVEAMLPAELLAALDEPLEDEDHETDAPARSGGSNLGANLGTTGAHPALGARDRTHDGFGPRTTGASTGGGATPGSTSLTGVGTGEEPLTPGPAATTRARAAPGDRRPETVPPPTMSALGPVESTRTASPTAVGQAPLGWSGPHSAMRVIARAIATRTSGSLCVLSEAVERRVVLREGDIVTCASNAEDESLLAFLGVRGELPRETVRRLGTRFPPFGRHAGAALVARGYLRQDQMWPTLRAHAEWVLGRILPLHDAHAFMEAHPPGRLAGEPGVFGGVTGAAAFVEVVRRVVAPGDALELLGGGRTRLGLGEAASLLSECGLAQAETDRVELGAGRTFREAQGVAANGDGESDFATVVLALWHLGVLEIFRAAGASQSPGEDAAAEAAALDSEAIRERVRARLQLVEDGDYFAVLGVPRDATGYEVRRAFLELRRAFDPSRLLSPEVLDLTDDVRDITTVLEEAYEILKDAPRRERYRRAIEGTPGNWN
jgi:CheY-like chemotaxis protein